MNVELFFNTQPFLPNHIISIGEWQEGEFSCVPPKEHSLVLRIESTWHTICLQPFLLPNNPTWYWRWNPKNAVGNYVLILKVISPDGDEKEHRFPFRVVPQKIDQQMYQQLLDDLHTSFAAILATLTGTATGATPVSGAGKPPPVSQLIEAHLSFLTHHIDHLEQAVWRIVQQPHTQSEHHTKKVDPTQAYDLSYVGNDISRGSYTTIGETIVPATITVAHSVSTPDTMENRLLKRLIEVCMQRAAFLVNIFGESTRNVSLRRTLAKQVQRINQRLVRLRALEFFDEIGPYPPKHEPSHIMRHHPAYRQIYRIWRELHQLPVFTVASVDFSLPIHELPRLYEYWCVAQLIQALLLVPASRVIQHNFLVHDTDGVPSRLVEDVPLLELAWLNATLLLRYQPRYRPCIPSAQPNQICSLDSHTHIPDCTLEIYDAGHTPSLLVFDAKYRIGARGDMPEDGLSDAYTYLGSLGLPTGKQVTRISTLLFPGGGKAQHYPSRVSVIPLLPGDTTDFQQWLIANIKRGTIP